MALGDIVRPGRRARKPIEAKCPECSEDLTGKDIIRHRNSHWGGVEPDQVRYPDAYARWHVLTEMAEAVREEGG